MSDTITVGNIHNSLATAIGDGASAVVHFINNPLNPDDRPKAAIQLPALAPSFTGRLALIQNIADGFVSDNGYSAAMTQVISGIGGVGKTQVALAYAHLYRSAYDIIWLLSADNSTALDDGLRQLGLTLELPLLGLDAAVMRGKVLSRLSQSGERALLIYDNADTIAPRDLLPYLPNGCHTLITSRRDDSQWGDMAKPLTLGTFTEEDGMAFWEKRLGAGEQGSRGELGEALDWLPLAMEQAAAFMLEETMDAAEYLQVFTEERDALWQREDAPNLYHATVATTWKMAFDHAKQTDGAADLLNLLSFFAPDDIPLDVVWDGADRLPDGLAAIAADKWKRRDSLKALRTYSLLTVTDGKANMHRLVQDVARRQMGADAAQEWAATAVTILSALFPANQNDLYTWDGKYGLMPHIQAATILAVKHEAIPEKTALVCNQLAFYQQAMGDYEAAFPFYQQALDIRKKVLGDHHPDTASSLNNMGYLLEELGEFEAAFPFYQQALHIRKKVLGDDHPDTAGSLNNMGGLLRALGEYEAARPFYQQALDIYKNVLGDDHPDTARSLNNMGSFMHAMGEYEAARPFYQQALDIRKKVLGDDHPDTAQSLNNIGYLLLAMGEYEAARPFYQQALDIYKNVLGDDHPDTAQSLNNMGYLLDSMEEYEAARSFYQQALDIRKKVLGDDHPDTAQSLNNMAALMQAMGEYEAARPFYQQALDIKKKVLGDDHPDTALSLNNMGYLLLAMGDYEAARPFYQQALDIRKNVLGDDHPDTAYSYNNMGMLLETEGEYEGAVPYYERALAIFEAGLGASHPNSEGVRNNLMMLQMQIQLGGISADELMALLDQMES